MIPPATPERALALYDQASAALVEVRSMAEAMTVSVAAEAIRVFARAAKDKALLISAIELRVLSERRVGEFLAETARNTGACGVGPIVVPERNRIPTLADLGVDKKLSARAQRLAALPADDFAALMRTFRDEAEAGAGAPSFGLFDRAVRKVRRTEREQDLAQKIRALPDRRFGVILADPPWRFREWGRDPGSRAADNHYPTMALEEILALPVQAIAASDAVLFLWTTGPMLPQAFIVMERWGFLYRSHTIWRKTDNGGRLKTGTGYWFMNSHELLLVGTRGDIPAPAPGEQWPSVVDAALGRHSEKPTRFHEMIEAYFPELPKVELFARGGRDGWMPWGAEAIPYDSEPDQEGQTAKTPTESS